MMIEIALGAFGVSLAGLWATVWATKARVEAQTVALTGAISALEDLQELAQDLAESPGAEEMVQVLSEMHVPTGQDHIQAAVATGMQMLFAKFLGAPQLGNLLGGLDRVEESEAAASYPPDQI